MKKWTFLLFLLLSSHYLFSQTMENMLQEALNTKDEKNKARLFNNFADTLLWQGDGVPYDAGIYLDSVENICKKIDCGEELTRTKALKALIDINSGNSEMVYDFVLPGLEKLPIQSPETKAILLQNCGLYYFFQGSLDSVYYYMSRCDSLLTKEAPQSKYLRGVKEYLGFYYSFKSIHDTSLIYMNQAADMHLAVGDTLSHIKAIKFASSFYLVMGKQEDALKTQLKSKALIEAYPPALYFLHNVNAGIGNSYLALKDYKEANHHFDKSLAQLDGDETLTDNKKVINRWDMVLGKAEALIHLNKEKEALTFIQTAESLCVEYNLSKLQIIGTKLLECEARIALEQFERANDIIQQVLEISASSEGRIEAYDIKAAKLLTKILFESDHIPPRSFMKEFMPLLSKVIDNNKGTYNKEVLQAYKLRTLLGIYLNNDQQAVNDYKNVMRQSDTLWNKEKTAVSEELLIAYETKEKEQLTNIQKLEIKQKTLQRNLLIGTVALLFLGLGFLLFYSRQRKKYAKKLELEVQKRTADLVQSNKELERFNYIASHDMKEPLRNIHSFTNLVKRKNSQDKDTLEYLDFIENNARQLSTLFEDVQIFSDIKNHSIKKQAIHVEGLIAEVFEQLPESIKKKNPKINFQGEAQIVSDRKYLALLFSNFIKNGLLYNDSMQATITIVHSLSETQHHFSFTDNGIGIDEAYHEQIFEMFKRLHNRAAYSGSGMGLAISKRIVEHLNGTISLQSKAGKGSSFTIQLPRK